MAEDKIQKTEEELKESAEKWKLYVRKEINSYLDTFLDVSVEGAINIHYNYAVVGKNEDGTPAELSRKEANGVRLFVDFKFETPLFFTDEDGNIE